MLALMTGAAQGGRPGCALIVQYAEKSESMALILSVLALYLQTQFASASDPRSAPSKTPLISVSLDDATRVLGDLKFGTGYQEFKKTFPGACHDSYANKKFSCGDCLLSETRHFRVKDLLLVAEFERLPKDSECKLWTVTVKPNCSYDSNSRIQCPGGFELESELKRIQGNKITQFKEGVVRCLRNPECFLNSRGLILSSGWTSHMKEID